MWPSLDVISDGPTEKSDERKMIISIDYDDTYTKDPLLWNLFAQQAMERGHKVYCISARSEQHMDDPKMTIGRVIGVENCFGTNLRPKRASMLETHKIRVDVWIDDMPEMIVENHTDGLFVM